MNNMKPDFNLTEVIRRVWIFSYASQCLCWNLKRFKFYEKLDLIDHLEMTAQHSF